LTATQKEGLKLSEVFGEERSDPPLHNEGRLDS
jgi:hypothetical protein